MRRTGSRESRDKREASATSPTSIAVKTFSIRFGSRRSHRPSHQKTRSSTTASAVIETIRIGHMIGPPFLKLSIKKFPVSASVDMPGTPFAAAGDAAPVVVVVVAAPGVIAVMAGVIAATGDVAAAAGLVIAAGAVAMPAGLACVPGAVGGVWLNKVSTKVTMQRL